MPIRDFRCPACQTVVEKIVRHDDAQTHVCEKCSAELVVVKEPTRTSFELKGKGWFKDGY